MHVPDSIRSFVRKNHAILFYGCWIGINLIQAGMTELFDDEAYYWAYSNYLDWGYFDHPPMIALMIKAGYFLFKNELGVRLMAVVLSTATLVIIQQLLPRKNDGLFYAIVCSMAVLQIGGIMAIPDIPLIFSTALFFLVYKHFLSKMSAKNALLLGLTIALMLYSKYHAVLVLFLVFLSYPKMLLRYQTWLALATALILFTPHLLWQYHHQFPSFRFHLVDRNSEQYDPVYTLQYFPDQILFAGPIAGFLLLWAAFSHISRNQFESTLKITMAGIYIFFLLSTVRGRVEANWTIPAFIPLIVLSHQYLIDRPKAAKWQFRLAGITLLLVLLGRIYMIIDTEPFPEIAKDEVHGNHAWVQKVEQAAGNAPVVFTDSYQYASKYWFYSGHPSFSLNTPYYHRNNYNFWPMEVTFFNKPVYVVRDRVRFLLQDTIPAGKGPKGGGIVRRYVSFSGMEVNAQNPIVAENFRVKNAEIVVHVSDSLRKLMRTAPYDKWPLELWVLRNDRLEKIINTGITIEQLTSGENHLVLSFPVNLPAGEYSTRFAVPSSVPNAATVNSSLVRLKVDPVD
jgi:hypothetical protein